MISALRRAVLSLEVDDREMSLLVAGASPWSATAALGEVLGLVGRGMVRDRRLLRSWLAPAEGVVA